MKPKKFGYTAGVFDLFHVGHLNLLQTAKSYCEHLTVAVSTDRLVEETKSKKPIIPFHERMRIVGAIREVDAVVPQTSPDKVGPMRRLQCDLLVVGDDWYGTPQWESTQLELTEIGAVVVYLPYTVGTSSTKINAILDEVRS